MYCVNFSMAANHYQNKQINNHPPECNTGIFWEQGSRDCVDQEKQKERREELIVTCSWCLNICYNISNLCIFKKFRVAISVGWSREKDYFVVDDSICWLPQAGPFVWVNKSTATGSFFQQIYWSCYLCYRSKAEEQLIMWFRWLLKEYAIIVSLIWSTWTTGVRFQSDSKSGSNNWIELNFARNTQLHYIYCSSFPKIFQK